MSVKRGGLGRNLSALLGTSEPVLQDKAFVPQVLTMPINCLQPGMYQPRRAMDEQAMLELAASIKQQGLLQPLVIRAIDGARYEIIAGERRWRACQMAAIENVPVIVKQVDDKTAMAMALIENLQREDLNPMDEARAMHRLTQEFQLTHQEISELLCKSRTAVSNYLRLLKLNPEVCRLVELGDLDMGHARSLLMLDHIQQLEVAKTICAKQLSVRATEALVAKVKASSMFSDEAPKHPPAALMFQQELLLLSQQLQTNVSIQFGKAGAGKLIIHCDDTQKLQMMIKYLGMTCQEVSD